MSAEYERWLAGQVRDLGRRVLDLQAQTTLAYHSARRFEIIAKLVGDLSVSVEHLDEVSLQAVFVQRVFGALLHIDAVALYQREEGGDVLELVASAGDPVSPIPCSAAPPEFAWASRDTPLDAFGEQLVEACGLRFFLWAWDREARFGLLLAKQLETRDIYHRFNPDDAPTVRSALRIYLDTRRRMQIEVALHRQLAQARILNHISTQLIHLSPESFDTTIREALGAVTELLSADRGAIFRVDRDGGATLAFLCTTPDAPPEIMPPSAIPADHIRGLLERLRLQRTIRLDAHEAPPLIPPGRSILFVPLIHGQSLDGFVTFGLSDAPTSWRAPDGDFLETMAGAFATALAAERDRIDREALQRQVQQAQKLNSLGVLAGGIAHDFNNILTPIVAGLDLIRLTHEGEPVTTTLIDSSLEAVERARRLVRQILLFARKNPVQRRPVAVEALLHDAADLLRASLPATIAMTVEVDPGPGARPLSVLGDAQRLEQVLLNLGTNAWQAMEGTKGELILGAARVEGLGGDCRIRIRVSDTGPGIPRDVLPHIYDPFFTTKPAGRGTGMGLAVAHGIVADHGGRISCTTGPDGTQFELLLPCADTLESEAPAAEAPPIPGGRERVLVVDDEPQISARIAAMLERLGYHARSLTSPIDALVTLAKAPTAWDLLLTDFTMPAMTGLELARSVQARAPHLVVLLCTGYHEPLSAEVLHEAGIHGMVHKPFRFRELAMQVRAALDRYPRAQG